MPVRSQARKPATPVKPAVRAEVNGSLSHAVLDSIITMNSAGIIQSASDSIEHLFGWTPTELFGKNIKMLIPEPRRSALDRYLDRYRDGDRTKVLQRTRRFDGVSKDGKVFQIELSMSRADLPREPPHSASYFIGIIRDVSREINVNSETPEERSRLQHLITEQTRALATANLRLHLADRLASLGTLAAGLGHDMNNVLLPVRARLNALERVATSPAAREHVTAVRQSIAYLQHLSDGLHFLALDPDGSGFASDREGTTDLVQWWKQVGALLRKAVPGHVKLQSSLEAGSTRLPHVRMAPHWLTQAVLNLIINAGEAFPGDQHGACVNLSAQVGDDGSTVRLSVADNGRGMSPGIQRRAFDLFFTTKPRSMGTGLGLPLARKVAVRAGGDVELQSTPGKGTTAVLVLPAVGKRAATSVRSARKQRKQTATVSIRNHRIAALVSQVLIAAGSKLTASASGPLTCDLWVTEASPKALSAAVRWRKRRAVRGRTRAVVLVGAPPKKASAQWAALGATIIDPPDDFEVIRHTLGEAMAKGQGQQRT